jgi:hypothetical protein
MIKKLSQCRMFPVDLENSAGRMRAPLRAVSSTPEPEGISPP